MEKQVLSFVKFSGDDNDLNLLEKTTLNGGEGIWITAETYDEVLVLIRNYETDTVSKFSCYTAAKNFGNIDSSAKHHRIRWEDDSISFNGTPFMVLGCKVLDCMHGKDRKVSFKEEYKMHLNEKKVLDHTFSKNYVMVQDTKKFNCSCQIKIKEIYQFPGFSITEDTKWRRVQSSKCFKDAKARNETVGKRILVFFPSENSHIGHFTGDNTVKGNSINEADLCLQHNL
ncbi:uncharacterized protein LOC136088917 isoform X2 [Hydra vulgaris]|uniref:Uncharacterized protein LOC136088917 isoform X2 n=1 Tax=Hydra vulgaris TaxID=6087 RepID=A0ABM4D776_HYDVU